jgi:hypothetical protein
MNGLFGNNPGEKQKIDSQMIRETFWSLMAHYFPAAC